MVDVVPMPPAQDIEAGPLTTDIVIETLQLASIQVQATHIPSGTTVEVRVVSLSDSDANCQFDQCPTCVLVGDFESSSCTVDVNLPPGRNEIQLKANWVP